MCQVINRSLFLWTWFLEVYFVSLIGPCFPDSLCVFFFPEFYTFVKIAISPSLYRMASYRGRPILVYSGRDSRDL